MDEGEMQKRVGHGKREREARERVGEKTGGVCYFASLRTSGLKHYRIKKRNYQCIPLPHHQWRSQELIVIIERANSANLSKYFDQN
jgi:hypothetical protein